MRSKLIVLMLVSVLSANVAADPYSDMVNAADNKNRAAENAFKNKDAEYLETGEMSVQVAERHLTQTLYDDYESGENGPWAVFNGGVNRGSQRGNNRKGFSDVSPHIIDFNHVISAYIKADKIDQIQWNEQTFAAISSHLKYCEDLMSIAKNYAIENANVSREYTGSPTDIIIMMGDRRSHLYFTQWAANMVCGPAYQAKNIARAYLRKHPNAAPTNDLFTK